MKYPKLFDERTMENRSDDPCAIYASFSQNNITMSNNNTGK
jgi:hypothetical protein